MKKLIELLKQFDIKNGRQYPEYKIEKGIVYKVYHNPFEGDEYIDWTLNIISKQFGFIQRLVKHFQLNVTKIDSRIALSDFNVTDRMLMALAISDNPIALLIDCLK